MRKKSNVSQLWEDESGKGKSGSGGMARWGQRKSEENPGVLQEGTKWALMDGAGIGGEAWPW
jgi:hypothetical protein